MQHAPPRLRGWLLAVGIMTLSLVGGLACPGNLDPAFSNTSGSAGMDGTGGGGSVTCDGPAALVRNCAISGCHDPNGQLGANLDLSSDQAQHLLGVSSMGLQTNGTICGAGMVYLDPGSSPATGLFIDKLTTPTCGNMMPYISSWMMPGDLDCVIQWANSVTAQ